ncbi:MAG: hypothetical protein J4G14_14125 [Dehalococcoidia bacterium]|nr:hypothetical protein [Dehalococcoidia bacterium]
MRIAEALALEVADRLLDAKPPPRVRAGKGNMSRIVPMRREMQAALRPALSYGSIGSYLCFHSSKSQETQVTDGQHQRIPRRQFPMHCNRYPHRRVGTYRNIMGQG